VSTAGMRQGDLPEAGISVSAAHASAPMFSTADAVRLALRDVGYFADRKSCQVLSLAARLSKPVLVEGPAGTGKTQLAKSIALAAGAPLIRLQCYEGLDESRALFEWDYRKQLLWIQAARDSGVDVLDKQGNFARNTGIFGAQFLLERPLLQAIRAEDPAVLLLDEVDRVDVETEALFLEVLSEFQVSVPELGTVRATSTPLVFLTSNASRQLSEALKRRCLYLYLDYPEEAREREIVRSHVPGIDAELARSVVELVSVLRRLELRKRPSISETIDFAQALLLIGATNVDENLAEEGLNILLKHRADIEAARMALLRQVTE
jgi:MoxR-like ATPase